jgi:hypothetical protein
MAVYAIGDIQGCAVELDALLEKIDFDARRDRLWFVGDLVNRGPDSLRVLRRVAALGDSSVVVLGNHDLHLLAVARGNARLKPADRDLQTVLDAPDRERLLDWLQARPMLHHDAALGVTMLHAGCRRNGILRPRSLARASSRRRSAASARVSSTVACTATSRTCGAMIWTSAPGCGSPSTV